MLFVRWIGMYLALLLAVWVFDLLVPVFTPFSLGMDFSSIWLHVILIILAPILGLLGKVW